MDMAKGARQGDLFSATKSAVLFILGALHGWKGEDHEQAERKKGASAVWARQDQQQCLAKGNAYSSCQSAELFNISISDTGLMKVI